MSRAKRIALITCATLPEPDFDEQMTLDALRQRGFEAELVPWDGGDRSLTDFDAAVIRSTWNYYENPEAFLHWVRNAALETRLLNPADVVCRNHHKNYLVDFGRTGVPIVPTEMVVQGDGRPIADISMRRGWRSVVVKPAISAGSFMTQRFDSGKFDQADDWLQQILQKGDAMVQEYLPSIASGGEVAFVWIGGDITHGVVKQPRFADGFETVSEAVIPSATDIERLERFKRLIPEGCLFARIDVMLGGAGNWLLSELELIEPSLFFKQYPPALDHFVAKLEAMLRVPV